MSDKTKGDYELVGTSEAYHDNNKASKFRTDGEAQKSSKHRADRSYSFFIGIGHSFGSQPSTSSVAPRGSVKAGSLRVSGHKGAHQIGKK